MASSGINKRGIAQFMRDVQKEMDKHPLTLPVQAETPDYPLASGATYHEPVVIAPGYEHTARTP